MTRIFRPTPPAFPEGTVLAEYDSRHSKRIARDEAALPTEERAFAETLRSATRRAGFTSGRLALHAALAESEQRLHAAKAVLRDQRGRPMPTWPDAAPISIAHSRLRAIAAVCRSSACAAIGVDVEEIDEHRAHALVRMSLSEAELTLVRTVDTAMLAGPIALWCARESCVKAHALEVGWFGTALVATRFDVCAPCIEGAERAWNLEISFESQPPMRAHAWQSRDAIFAVAARMTS